MKCAIILAPDKEACARLRALMNILFPEVDVVCVSQCPDEAGRVSPPGWEQDP